MSGDLPPGFSIDPTPPKRRRSTVDEAAQLPAGFTLDRPETLSTTGQAYDGDTFRLRDGRNARLYGADAFERQQTGRGADGRPVPLGAQARDALLPYIQPGAEVRPTGAETYGRPVASVSRGGEDAGRALLHDGLAVATPKYLRGDMPRLREYMQEERLARLNRRGAHAGTYQTPEEYRRNPQEPAPGEYGNAQALFWDDPTPSQGLPPEQERGLMAIWQDFTKGPADYVAYAKANGIQVDPEAAATQFARRDRDQKAGGNGIPTVARPRVLTDPGDGRTGAVLRGFADPFNMLDEAGAVVDSLLPGSERENIWSSDRRFGDVYANNLEQNRAILDHDAKDYEWWRFGGQLASGLAMPGASVEGVGLGAARAALRGGASRYAAEQAARRAFVGRLATAGGVEGAAAGAGQGETWPERAQGAAIGGPAGAALGVGAGVLAPRIARAVGRPFSRLRAGAGERTADDFASGAVDAGKAIGNNDALDAPLPDALSIPEASAATLADDPLAIAPASQPRPLPRDTYRGPISDHAPVIWREMGFGSEGFGRLTMPSEYAGRWRNEGGTDLLQFADTPALATGQGANKGILFEYDAAPFVGRPKLDKPGSPLAWQNGAGEYTTSGVTQEMLQSALRGFKIKPGAVDDLPSRDRAILTRITDDLQSRGWTRSVTDDGSEIYRRPSAEGAGSAAMASEIEAPSITGPAFTDDAATPAVRPRSLLADAPDAERAAAADRVASHDVLPLPANSVDGIEEAARIERGRYDPVRVPNETKELASRSIPHARTGTPINVRGPLDLSSWLRMEGGIKPVGGELEHLGITNAPRKGMDLTGGDRLGPLVAQDGMSYDDAAYRAWEAGFFPDRFDPPSINEFLDALDATHSGRSRLFRADEMPEVDAFYGARQQRYDVERAADQGAPLTSDRGQPVGPDDLDANAPPVRAYEEWGENAPNLAGNIRLDKLDSPQAIKRALTQTEKVAGGFDAARRGRITQAETQNLANELGMTPDNLLARRKGQAFNAEEALAARQILARSAADLVNMAKRIARSENPGDEVEAAFREAWLRHAAIQEQVSGMTAEAGRALQQFRQTADARQVGRVLPSLGDLPGGSARLKEVADQIVDLEAAGVSPGGINRFAVKALRVRKRDMAMEYYINALLSGPQTHAVNILSNTMTALAQIPEHGVAAGVGVVRRLGEKVASRLLGREIGGADRVLFSEMGSRTVGLVQGTKDGLGAALRTFRTGDSPDAVAKVESASFEAIPGMAGKIIRTPTRLLSAEDELFKGMARRMELTGIAIRKAHAEGLRGAEAKRRAADLLENPTEPMLDQAQDYARYLTFQSPLGPMTSKIAGAANSNPALKFLIPFVRTPTNLLKFAMERSPAAPLLREWRKDVAAGGARRDLAAARALVGTGIGALFYEAALDRRITGGGPADDNAKRLMMADGWQPYSVRVGDTYYSYRRLDPFSTTIGTVADMVDLGSHMTDKQREKSGMLVTAAIMNNLASKTWLTGISGVAEALSDPDRYWTDFVSRSAGAIAVPSIVAQVARTTDPIIREARDPMSRIRSRVPGMSDDLFPKRDVFGRPDASEGGVGPDLISPIWKGERRNDPTIRALVDANVSVGRAMRTYSSAGKRMEYTPAQFDRYQELTGQYAKPGLDALVGGARWKAMDQDARQDAVAGLMKAARRQAKDQVLGGVKTPDALPAGFRLDR
ncbi:thermonuclease family protein [uncultured Sphingomonas sp.]|uniref:thermonuclease family protein n=1 Tax=uncultured Sphingomonas sp. TaxID=158754 RepID=UPI00374A759A